MRVGIFFVALMLSGCGLYWNYAGSEVDAYEGPMPQTKFVLRKSLEVGHKVLVLIRLPETGDVIYGESDADHEFHLGANKIKLLPGKYFIRIADQVTSTGSGAASGNVELIAGRTYYVDSDACIGFAEYWCDKPRVTYVWMEDSMTGEVVLGERY